MSSERDVMNKDITEDGTQINSQHSGAINSLVPPSLSQRLGA